MSRCLVSVLVVKVAVALWAGAGVAAEEPMKAPEARPEFIVSEMRLQRLPGPTLLCAETESTLARIGEVAGKTVSALLKATHEGGIGITGPLAFAYLGASGEPNKPFQVTIGFPVAEGTKTAGDFKIKKLADLRCATVLFSGPMSKIGDAYGKLFPALMAAGHVPTGETREYMLYWESAESPNNVVLIQAGIKEP